MALLAGGASAQLVRDPGTANAVQGFGVGGAIAGARLSTALPFTAIFQAGDGIAQQGVREILGSLDATLGALTLTASGSLGGGIAGSLSVTLGDVSVSSTGRLEVRGTLSQTLDALTLSAAGQLTSGITGTLSQTLGQLTATATGTLQIRGTLAATLTRTERQMPIKQHKQTSAGQRLA